MLTAGIMRHFQKFGCKAKQTKRSFSLTAPTSQHQCATIRNKDKKFHVCEKMAARKPPVAQRKLWSLESMVAAVRDVESGGLREAAHAYNCPVEMLRRRTSGQVTLDCKSGPGTVLTREEEEALAQYCMKRSETGFGLGREDVMHVAFAIAEKSG